MLSLATVAVVIALPAGFLNSVEVDRLESVTNLLKPYLAKPGKWVSNPVDAVYEPTGDGQTGNSAYKGVIGAFVIIGVL